MNTAAVSFSYGESFSKAALIIVVLLLIAPIMTVLERKISASVFPELLHFDR